MRFPKQEKAGVDFYGIAIYARDLKNAMECLEKKGYCKLYGVSFESYLHSFSDHCIHYLLVCVKSGCFYQSGNQEFINEHALIYNTLSQFPKYRPR